MLGPSGSGKTTLLMVLAGFTRPDRGSIKFGEDEVIRKPPHLRDVGVVFQNYALFPHMTVAGNVGYPLRLRHVPKAEIAERIEQALEIVQLGGYGERRIDQLSGGQKQRAALAQRDHLRAAHSPDGRAAISARQEASGPDADRASTSP